MEFSTPWDELDLDLLISPSQIPRLRLPAPGFYFALLPLETYPKTCETRWQKATTAHEMRLITFQCIEGERRVLNKIAALKLNDSHTFAATLGTQEPKPRNLKVADTAPVLTAADQMQTSRKRTRAKKVGNVSPTRRSKRIKVANQKKAVASSSLPPPPASTQISRDETATEDNATNSKLSPSNQNPMSSNIVPRFNPFDNPSASGNIVDIHRKIYNAVDALHNLILQAEAVEHNLLAIRTQSDITTSLLRQCDMDKSELEHLLEHLQISAETVLGQLEAASMSALNLLGFRSLPMAEFRALDPRKTEILSYDFELEWEIKVFGLFEWWLYYFNGSLR